MLKNRKLNYDDSPIQILNVCKPYSLLIILVRLSKKQKLAGARKTILFARSRKRVLQDLASVGKTLIWKDPARATYKFLQDSGLVRSSKINLQALASLTKTMISKIEQDGLDKI